jgi:hypothetical protein
MVQSACYTLHPCRNGREFKTIPNWTEGPQSRVITGGNFFVECEVNFRIRGVISRTASDVFIDVDKV